MAKVVLSDEALAEHLVLGDAISELTQEDLDVALVGEGSHNNYIRSLRREAPGIERSVRLQATVMPNVGLAARRIKDKRRPLEPAISSSIRALAPAKRLLSGADGACQRDRCPPTARRYAAAVRIFPGPPLTLNTASAKRLRMLSTSKAPAKWRHASTKFSRLASSQAWSARTSVASRQSSRTIQLPITCATRPASRRREIGSRKGLGESSICRART